MVWYLLLAHLIADFPLQPNWLVKAKVHLKALGLHIFIHLVVMLILVGQARQVAWLPILVLALTHFVIDYTKNTVNRLRPDWVNGPYIIDQLFHFGSIWAISAWIERQNLPLPLPFPTEWIIVAIGYLFVTYVWFISEKIFAYTNPAYRQELQNQLWPRMLTRALLLSAFLFFWNFIPMLAFAVTAMDRLPYITGKYRHRALITDLGVAMIGLVFIQSAG